MAAKTRLKILTTANTTTAPAILKTGELAYSYEDTSAGQGQAGERMYIGVGAEDGNGVASSTQIIGGKYFTDLLNHSHGSLQASSALITDPNSKLFQLKVDNLDLNGNTISSTDTNGDIIIDPDGSGNTQGKLVLHNPYINGTTDTLEEFIYDTVGGAVTGTAGSVVVTNSDAGNTSTISLADQITAASNVGSATEVPKITFNSKGQLTAVTTESISTSFTLSADNGSNVTFSNGQTLNFAGTGNEIETTVSSNQIQIGLVDNPTVGGNLTVTGNLVVNGNTTTVNSTTITIDDPIFTLGGDTAPGSDDGKDRGIEFRWHDGSDAKLGFFGFDDSDSKFAFIPDATNTSEVFSGTLGDAKFGGIRAGTVIAGETAGTVTTSAGKLILDSADGEVEINDALDLNGTLNVSGAVTFATALTVPNGGTGVTSFTNNGVVYGDGANALDVTAASSAVGSVLQTAAAGGVPAFSNIIDGGAY